MRVSRRFGELVKSIKGEDSFGKAAIKTEISKAYLVEMAAGKVPSRSVIEQFARRYADRGDFLCDLLIAAGYEESGEPTIKTNEFVARLRASKLDSEAIQQVEALIREAEEAEKSNKSQE